MRKMAVLVLVLFIIGLITSIIQTRNILDLGYLLVLLGFGIKLKKSCLRVNKGLFLFAKIVKFYYNWNRRKYSI